MNETSHFFGAYLDLVTRPIDYQLYDRRCSNGHVSQSKFCPTCGNLMIEAVITQQRNVTDHHELLDDDLADTLSVITPARMFGTGRIILRSNRSDGSLWLDIGGGGAGLEIKPFPTDDEQAAMMAELLILPAVETLRWHPQVVSASVEAGYVEDREY